MKPTRLSGLAAGAACVACLPFASLPGAEPTPPAPAGSSDSSSSSTSVSALVTDGKGTITITVEKDGNKETRTIDLNSNDPAKLAEELVKEIKIRGDADAAPPKRKLTYLGVMFAETPETGGPGGAWPFPPGTGAEGSRPTPGLPAGTGLTITGVSPGSPAEKAGLQGGDVLSKLDDQILVNTAQFTTLIRNKKEGDTVRLAFVRQGESKQSEVALASREEEESGAFGFGSGGFGGSGRSFFRYGKGSGDGFNQGRVLSVDENGKVLEQWLGDNATPKPVPPGAPPLPPVPPVPGAQDKFMKLHESGLPQWEKALRDAADVKDKAAEQWKEQLSKWRDQWAESQEKAAADYRRAIEKMGDEIRKANEAAQKAQEDVRRALEAWKEKRSEEKGETNDPQKKDPGTKEPEKKDPDQPKKA